MTAARRGCESGVVLRCENLTLSNLSVGSLPTRTGTAQEDAHNAQNSGSDEGFKRGVQARRFGRGGSDEGAQAIAPGASPACSASHRRRAALRRHGVFSGRCMRSVPNAQRMRRPKPRQVENGRDEMPTSSRSS